MFGKDLYRIIKRVWWAGDMTVLLPAQHVYRALCVLMEGTGGQLSALLPREAMIEEDPNRVACKTSEHARERQHGKRG